MRIVDDAAVGPYERVVHAEDAASGLRTIVAVHSTALGPAAGGTRFHPYASAASAVIDALRLAEGMTMKAAVAGLPLGGGKAVIVGDPREAARPRLWEAYARVIDHLGGSYLAAEDVGTGVADMVELRRHTPHVIGLPQGPDWDGDPSPFTARGVAAAMRAAWAEETGADSLAGVRVVVVGVGKVGGRLARLLAAEGAEVAVSDVDAARSRDVARDVAGRILDPAAALAAPCDILAPCALGGVLTPASAAALRCRWVVGAANNQLSEDAVADLLARRHVGYVPDFVANGGGVISIAEAMAGGTAESAADAVDRIAETVTELIEAAAASGGTLLAAARRRAASRLALAAATS